MKYLEIKKIIAERAVRALPSQRLAGFRELMAEFGVSQSTVSKALDMLEQDGIIIRKRGGAIMPAVSKRSITVAKRKYQPEKKSHTILFSYKAFYSGGLWTMLHMVEMCAHARRSNIIFHKCTPDTTMEEFVETVKSQPRLTGVIFNPPPRRMTSRDLELLGTLSCKVVIFYAGFLYPELPDNVYCVMRDELTAGRMLAEYLLSQGHRKPGFVFHQPKTDSTENFFRGIRTSYQQHGYPISEDAVFRAGTLPWEDALTAAENVVRSHISEIREENLSSLIFASSDGAVSAIRALRENGFRVPEEIGIAGHGDMPLYQHMPDVPALVCYDYAESANAALDIILKRATPAEKLIYMQPMLKPYNGILPRE